MSLRSPQGESIRMRINSMHDFNDTIFALSSGGLPAGLAVVRISGPEALSATRILAGSLPEPRQAALKTICTRNGLIVDQGVVLIFLVRRPSLARIARKFTFTAAKPLSRRFSESLRPSKSAGWLNMASFHAGPLRTARWTLSKSKAWPISLRLRRKCSVDWRWSILRGPFQAL